VAEEGGRIAEGDQHGDGGRDRREGDVGGGEPVEVHRGPRAVESTEFKGLGQNAALPVGADHEDPDEGRDGAVRVHGKAQLEAAQPRGLLEGVLDALQPVDLTGGQ